MKTNIYKNIIADEEICGARPTIEGTRITVKTIIGHLLEGDSEEVLLKGFPRLSKEDINTIKEYASLQFDPKFFVRTFS
ncbi:MAG: DUF433 domain-containing protein [Bacteroidota bacterium]|nr:DUF433 domain-containing protein [Bacteroidota bacterium]